jgi:hypothetical protein
MHQGLREAPDERLIQDGQGDPEIGCTRLRPSCNDGQGVAPIGCILIVGFRKKIGPHTESTELAEFSRAVSAGLATRSLMSNPQNVASRQSRSF